jgi:Chitobiase/beta-hexosaminidase C-terminal domain
LAALATNPNEWAFPDLTLGANARIVVYASGKDRRDPGGKLHTNFSLKAGGEYVGIYDANGSTVLSEYALVLPLQTDDRSYRLDGAGVLRSLSSPNPGTENGIGDTPMALPVATSVHRGFYRSSFSVELSTLQTGGQIRYTLNGSEPTSSNGDIYSDPISVSTTTTLRAATFASGLAPSPVITHTYIFLSNVFQQPKVIAGFPNDVMQSTGTQGSVVNDMAMDPVVINNYSTEIRGSMSAIPTMSMVGDLDDIFGPNGFYFTVGTEKKVSIELLHVNTTENTQVYCGAEGHSHNRIKRSLKISFRPDYGVGEWETTLLQNHAPVNGATAEKRQRSLVLRGGNNRCWARDWNPDKTSYTEDEFYRATFTEMNNGVGSHGTFVHLYL